MERVKCAVIGAGWWGTTSHVPALRDNPHADLVAVQHHDKETAERVARDFGVPHACTTAEEVLAIDGLQAAVISSVPALHYAQGMAALERGLHVLIEKPFTIRGEDGRESGPPGRREGGASHGGCHLSLHPPLPGGAPGVAVRVASAAVRMISILFTNLTQGLYRGLEWDEAMPTEDEARSEHQRPYLAAGPAPRTATRRSPAADRSTRRFPIRPPTSATSPSAGRSRCSPVSRTTEPRWTSTTRSCSCSTTVRW